jgi:hypothetical protein
MIKPVLKYCIPIYLLLGYTTLVALRRGDVSVEVLLVLLIPIAIIIVLGLFFGVFISVLIKKPNHESKFYWIGQLASILLVTAFFIYAWEDNNHKRSNAEENELTIRNVTDSDSRPFVLPAFDSLKLKFKSPNDLHLNSVTSFVNDDGLTVYFAYNLIADHAKEYYSKYKVENGQARLVQFNLDTRSTIDYLHVSRQQDALKDTLKKYEKIMK